MNRVVVPFLACGDLSAYDSDKTYDVPESDNGATYISLPPTQAPINPPYELACKLKKNNLLAKLKQDVYTNTETPKCDSKSCKL